MSNLPLKILIVDDDETMQKLVSFIAKKIGDVEIAENGKIGVQKAGLFQPGLILMDMQMPVMDGLTAVKTIRESAGPESKAKIVAMTGEDSDEEKTKILQAGCDDIITKPFDPMSLFSRLKEILNLS